MVLLADDVTGTVFEAGDVCEAEVLHHEIFVRGVYDGIVARAAERWERRAQAGRRRRHGPFVVVDVGANIGLFTLRAAHLLAARAIPAIIYAIEPIPATFAILQRNLRRAGLSTKTDVAVRPLCCAMGRLGCAPTATFTVYPLLPGESTRHPGHKHAQHVLVYGASHAERMAAEAETIECPVQTLSQLMAREQITRVDVLKIDCEGDELDVLAGLTSKDWLEIQAVQAEVEDYPEAKLEMVRGLLQANAFHPIQVIPQCTETTTGQEESGAFVVVVPPELSLSHVLAER